MHVEVNERNIDLYGLAQLTGNTREQMLSRAAEAAEKGYVLSCEVPDDQVLEHNVFDVYETEHVDPARLRGCHYQSNLLEGGGTADICVVHGKVSNHDLSLDPNAPCIQVDSEERSTLPSDPMVACVYNHLHDPLEGSVYICAVHGSPSKHDLERMPNAPCIVVDP